MAAVTSLPLAAESLNEAVRLSVQTTREAAESQARIDRLDDATRKLFDRYRASIREVQRLQVYAKQLEQLVDTQEAEKISLQRQLDEIERTQREITPLMLRMVDSLEQFVKLDLPFLADERQGQLVDLRQSMADPQLGLAEKYRRVLAAYQRENDYGRSIETYRADAEFGGERRVLNFLRVGRTALYYQSLDADEVGYWDAAARQWETLPAEQYLEPLTKAFRVAAKKDVPALIELPLPAADASSEQRP